MPNPIDKVLILAIYVRVRVIEFKPKSKEFYSVTIGKHL
jgi:hypothetical protein